MSSTSKMSPRAQKELEQRRILSDFIKRPFGKEGKTVTSQEMFVMNRIVTGQLFSSKMLESA